MRHVLLLALLLEARPAAASCMQASLAPVVLTRRDTKLPADGGVLVGYTYATGEDREVTGPDPSDVTWTAIAGKKTVVLARTQLAPGLSVYRPAAGVTGFTLVTKTGKERGTFTHDGAGEAAMPAPKPRAVKTKSEHEVRWTNSETMLTLDAAPPADAVAIIAYDDHHKALLFATLPDTHDKLRELAIDHSSGHCGTPQPPEHGYVTGAVTFAWVDAFGRLSPASKPVTVQ
jgi:hypothetical protein